MRGSSSSWSQTTSATSSISGESTGRRLGLRDEELLFYDLKFDGWNFTSKLVDLPTIMESHKTLDNKNFYKTADICQLLICKEG
jgi:TATA-binding protein-associated factor Taf7